MATDTWRPLTPEERQQAFPTGTTIVSWLEPPRAAADPTGALLDDPDLPRRAAHFLWRIPAYYILVDQVMRGKPGVPLSADARFRLIDSVCKQARAAQFCASAAVHPVPVERADDADLLVLIYRRPLTNPEFTELRVALDVADLESQYALMPTTVGAAILNLPGGLPNAAFHDAVRAARTMLTDDHNAVIAPERNGGFYVENDWRINPDGEGYVAAARQLSAAAIEEVLHEGLAEPVTKPPAPKPSPPKAPVPQPPAPQPPASDERLYSWLGFLMASIACAAVVKPHGDDLLAGASYLFVWSLLFAGFAPSFAYLVAGRRLSPRARHLWLWAALLLMVALTLWPRVA